MPRRSAQETRRTPRFGSTPPFAMRSSGARSDSGRLEGRAAFFDFAGDLALQRFVGRIADDLIHPGSQALHLRRAEATAGDGGQADANAGRVERRALVE